MARKILFVDDIDGSETETVTERTFYHPVSGDLMAIDLSNENWERLQDALSKFVNAGREVKVQKGNSTSQSTEEKEYNGRVRTWGRENAEWADKVGERGRFPLGLVDAYNAAHPTDVFLAGDKPAEVPAESETVTDTPAEVPAETEKPARRSRSNA